MSEELSKAPEPDSALPPDPVSEAVNQSPTAPPTDASEVVVSISAPASESNEPEPVVAAQSQSAPASATSPPPRSTSVSPSQPPQSTVQQVLQVLQVVWAKVFPVLRTVSVVSLRLMVQLAQKVLMLLESRNSSATPPPAAPSTPGESPPVTASPATAPKTLPPSGLVPRIFSLLEDFWRFLLAFVRSRIPVSLRDQISDRTLSIGITGVLAIVFWITSGILSGPAKSPAKAPVASRPVPSEVSNPVAPQPVADRSDSAPVVPSPKSPAEQKRLVAIQEQMTTIADRYGTDLVQATDANFKSSQLTLKLSDRWYELNAIQQDQLTSDLLQRAQKLKFEQFEVTDPTNRLVARKAIVGKTVVILERHAVPPEATS